MYLPCYFVIKWVSRIARVTLTSIAPAKIKAVYVIEVWSNMMLTGTLNPPLVVFVSFIPINSLGN